MRVALEFPFYAQGARGPAQYAEHLARALGPASPSDEFLLFAYFHGDYRRRLDRIRKPPSANVRPAVRRWPQSVVALAEDRLGWPWVDRLFLRPEGVDVLHAAACHPVGPGGPPVVFMVHGTGFMFHGIHPHMERKLAPYLRGCARVTTPSRGTRDFLRKYYDLDASRIEVVPYGVDRSMFFPVDDAQALAAARGRYSLPERFLLCVGPFQFRDNVEHLLHLVREKGEEPWLRGVRVVLAGGSEEHAPALRRFVRQSGLESRVAFLGNVPQADLAAIYSQAEALVHSSYYEEGGAQLLEASACGVPILASTLAGWVHEHPGAGALQFSPHHCEELAGQLRRLLEDSGLRRELGQKGLEWSRAFSWETVARTMLEVYRAAARA